MRFRDEVSSPLCDPPCASPGRFVHEYFLVEVKQLVGIVWGCVSQHQAIADVFEDGCGVAHPAGMSIWYMSMMGSN